MMTIRKAVDEKPPPFTRVLAMLPSCLGVARASFKAKHKLIRRLTIETERTFIFRNRSEEIESYCAECGAQTGRVDQ